MASTRKFQDFGNKKERYNLHNYLTVLVKSLENKHTVIDLRNESCVSGLIKHVDGLMNVEMESVVFYDPQGCEHKFDSFYVSARNIRYVHIPSELSITELMENQMNELDNFMVKEPKKDSLRVKRLKQKSAQTVREWHESQPGPSRQQ